MIKINRTTPQMQEWMGPFGREYTKRNVLTLEQVDELYKKNYGITRIDLNNIVIGKLDRSLKILEVGTDIGNQLLMLHKMGFKNLYGIE